MLRTVFPSPPLPKRVRRALFRGFTLVELMIVVAIIGILSAIAVPQYQIYTGKAQLTEAIVLASGRKAAVTEEYAIGASFATIAGGKKGIPADIPSGAGEFVESLAVTGGTIIAVMRSSRVASCVTGATVTLTPYVPTSAGVNISWACSTNANCKPISCM